MLNDNGSSFSLIHKKNYMSDISSHSRLFMQILIKRLLVAIALMSHLSDLMNVIFVPLKFYIPKIFCNHFHTNWFYVQLTSQHFIVFNAIKLFKSTKMYLRLIHMPKSVNKHHKKFTKEFQETFLVRWRCTPSQRP